MIPWELIELNSVADCDSSDSVIRNLMDSKGQALIASIPPWTALKNEFYNILAQTQVHGLSHLQDYEEYHVI